MKLPYRPVSILASVLGGLLAGAIFKWVWKAAAGEDEAPKATDALDQGKAPGGKKGRTQA